jgi:hypothetical protein
MEATLNDVGKYETSQHVSLNLKACNDAEESKIAKGGEVSSKRVSPASVEPATIGRITEKSSNTY